MFACVRYLMLMKGRLYEKEDVYCIKLGMFMGICIICAGMANSAIADTVFLEGTDVCMPDWANANY
jgi:hypothetical protein